MTEQTPKGLGWLALAAAALAAAIGISLPKREPPPPSGITVSNVRVSVE